uniref:Uncharacterized protein n=1 Tax=Anguilla anguilla TaxID=7936 RepID=A0A0E9X0I0_ANGAN
MVHSTLHSCVEFTVAVKHVLKVPLLEQDGTFVSTIQRSVHASRRVLFSVQLQRIFAQ